MKILQINTNDVDGGAARSAYRIHQGLLDHDIESTFFVQRKHLADVSVISTRGKMNRIYSMANMAVEQILQSALNIPNNAPWSANYGMHHYLKEFVCRSNEDIIHLHWINNNFLPLGLFEHIKKPIVWTLHDSWTFTGGCHIPYECKKYRNQCQQCEQLNRKNWLDISKRNFNRKKDIFKNIKLHIVTPSQWLYDCAISSALLKDKDIHLIPNGINITQYKPQDKNFARTSLGIPVEKKIILFGAMGATSDKNKGFESLIEALHVFRLLAPDENIEILIFGSQEPTNKPDFGYKATYMGRLQDDISLSLLYSAADVMVVPSKSENLPNTIMESLACGTPCVAFEIGGIPDMIDHKENGYLAKPYEAEDLAKGIAHVLADEENWQRLSRNARKKVIENFGIDMIAKKYIALYEEILENSECRGLK